MIHQILTTGRTGIRIPNHNQTIIRQPLLGINPNHNQTIRPFGSQLNHNQTVVVRRPGLSYNHNQTLVRR